MLEYTANAAHLSSLAARIRASTLRGNAAVTDVTTGAMSFDLSINRIDLDRYLPAKPAKTAAAPAPQAGAAPSQQATELPTSALKTSQLNGNLPIGEATIYGTKLSQVAVGLAADGGVLHINPATTKLNGGSSTGNVMLDAHGAMPVPHRDESLTGIDVLPLLEEFAKLGLFSGRGVALINSWSRLNVAFRTVPGHFRAGVYKEWIAGAEAARS